ncbi:hypothetical protein HYW76_01330 [Candidatus Pacearchaeota archaeon]|nr:hypothetical protein [Candidatus Pacearchaeota archaeon]
MAYEEEKLIGIIFGIFFILIIIAIIIDWLFPKNKISDKIDDALYWISDNIRLP